MERHYSLQLQESRVSKCDRECHDGLVLTIEMVARKKRRSVITTICSMTRRSD